MIFKVLQPNTVKNTHQLVNAIRLSVPYPWEMPPAEPPLVAQNYLVEVLIDTSQPNDAIITIQARPVITGFDVENHVRHWFEETINGLIARGYEVRYL